MKKIILYPFLSLSFILLIPTNSYCQIWSSLVSGTPNHLVAVSAINIDTCYVAGSSGTILKTTDGGLTWINQPTPTSQTLYGMDFINSNNGFAVGDNGALLKTTNGGVTWTSITATTQSLRSVKYFNSMQAVITGANGLIIKTTDGGVTWSPVSTGTSSNIYGLRFTSPTDGYATCFSGDILKTTDGGTTWTPSSTGVSTQLNTISFSGASNGVVVGASGVIRRTTDGGVTWSTVTMPSISSDFLHSHGFLTPSNGFVTGGNIGTNVGIILETTDGGLTWVAYYPGTPRLCNVDFPDIFTGYAVGLNGTILKFKINGGVGITETTQQKPVELTAFPNPTVNYTSIDLTSLNIHGTIYFELFDATGKLLRSEKHANADMLKIEREELKSGVYFYNVNSKDKTEGTGKIIIE